MAISPSIVNKNLLSRDRILEILRSIRGIYISFNDTIFYQLEKIQENMEQIRDIIRSIKKEEYKKIKKEEYKKYTDFEEWTEQYINNLRIIKNNLKNYIQNFKRNQFEVYKQKFKKIINQIKIFTNEVNKREKEGLEQSGNTEKIIKFFFNEIKYINEIFKDTIQTIIKFLERYKELIDKIIKYSKTDRLQYITEKIELFIERLKYLIAIQLDIKELYNKIEGHFLTLMKNIRNEWEF